MTLYEILQVDPGAPRKAIEKAYRRLVLQHHPDRNPGDEEAAARFQAVQDAWEVLGDERRARYDATGETGLRVDNEAAKVTTLLSQSLGAVLNELVENGRDPAQEDVVGRMRVSLARRREEIQARRLDIQKGKHLLASITDRFVAKEGENTLQSIARSHLAGADVELGRTENELATTERAIDLLKRFSFKSDQRPVWEAPDLGLGHFGRR